MLATVVILIIIFFGVAYKVGADNIDATIYSSPYQPVSWTINASESTTISSQGSIIYVAQGEPANISFSHKGGTCWYFQQSGGSYGPEYYDIPSVTEGNGSVCAITPEISYTLKKAQYTVLYTFPSTVNNKTFKDVSWKDGSLYSIFGNTKPINEEGRTPDMILEDLQNTIHNDGIDGIESSNIVIQEPSMYITRLEQTGLNVITLSGTTNLKEGDTIHIVIDNGDFDQQPTAKNFTYDVKVVRPGAMYTGTFSVDMIIPIQQMPSGWHTVTATSHGITSTVRFPIYETWKPEPTPTQYINYFSNGNVKPDIVTVVQTVVQIQTVERWHTATPTPSITDALGNTIDYPYSAGGKIPEYVAILSMIGIAALVLMRDYKRK